jgi:general secretion pathway protein G
MVQCVDVSVLSLSLVGIGSSVLGGEERLTTSKRNRAGTIWPIFEPFPDHNLEFRDFTRADLWTTIMNSFAKMKRTTRSPRSTVEGFTLVELLVVLAIVGLIAALATPQVLRYLESAKIDTTRAQIRNYESSLELYYIDNGRYPSTEEGLAALLSKPASAANWNGPYIRNQTTFNDAWNTPYQYKSPAENKPFEIISFGQDRQAGGRGQAADLSSN